jgi:hypothetical protein
MVKVDSQGYLRYPTEYLRNCQQSIMNEDSPNEEGIISLLIITLIRAEIYNLREKDADELGDRVRRYVKRRKAEQKFLLDEYSRESSD